jgi:hypothetical protein
LKRSTNQQDRPFSALLAVCKRLAEEHQRMAPPEQAKRAFQTARASMRRKKLKELAIAIALGLVASLVITLIILLLNIRPKF